MDTVRVRWADKRQLVGWDSRGHGVVMDTPPESNGEATGARPVELVLYALAGCTGIDVVSVLEKKRLDVRGVEVIANGEQRLDEHPHYYKSINLEYIVTGVDVPDEAVARAIELSETKYCSVKGCFGPQVEVTTHFRVVPPAPPGPAPKAGEQA